MASSMPQGASRLAKIRTREREQESAREPERAKGERASERARESERASERARGREGPCVPESDSGTGVGLVVGAAEALLRHVGVDLGARQGRVAQELLHRAEICAAVEHVCGGGVAQIVRGGVR